MAEIHDKILQQMLGNQKMRGEEPIIEELAHERHGRKAHENMDEIIGQNEMQAMLKLLYSGGNAGMLREFAGTMNPSVAYGSSYETDPGVLAEHNTILDYLRYLEGFGTREGHQSVEEALPRLNAAGLQERPSEPSTLLDYLSGAVSEQGSNNRYMHGIDERELNKRMAQIKKYPSKVDKTGIERYTIPLLVEDSWPPEYEKQTRSMEHWIQDYPILESRSSINNP